MFVLSGCAGMKVISPKDENKDKGTKMLDLSSGSPKVVSTYKCKLDSMGHKFSALGKSEKEARDEVLARCHDKAIITFCKSDKITCVQN